MKKIKEIAEVIAAAGACICLVSTKGALAPFFGYGLAAVMAGLFVAGICYEKPEEKPEK